jgi:macrophage erythroblast attacher
LARPLPYAHHSKSHVESDPVMLPNGRIYGRERLVDLNEKLGTAKHYVRDPVEPDRKFQWSSVRKVYIM